MSHAALVMTVICGALLAILAVAFVATFFVEPMELEPDGEEESGVSVLDWWGGL